MPGCVPAEVDDDVVALARGRGRSRRGPRVPRADRRRCRSGPGRRRRAAAASRASRYARAFEALSSRSRCRTAGDLGDRPRHAVDQGDVAEHAVLELRPGPWPCAVLEGHRRDRAASRRPRTTGRRWPPAGRGRPDGRPSASSSSSWTRCSPNSPRHTFWAGRRHGVVVVPERGGPLLHRVGVVAASRRHPRGRVRRHAGHGRRRGHDRRAAAGRSGSRRSRPGCGRRAGG